VWLGSGSVHALLFGMALILAACSQAPERATPTSPPASPSPSLSPSPSFSPNPAAIKRCKLDAKFLTSVDKKLGAILRKAGSTITQGEYPTLVADLGALIQEVKAHRVEEHFRETKRGLIDGLTKIKKGFTILITAVTGAETGQADDLINEGQGLEGANIAGVVGNRSDCIESAMTPPSS
jgi:hypothetical protein